MFAGCVCAWDVCVCSGCLCVNGVHVFCTFCEFLCTVCMFVHAVCVCPHGRCVCVRAHIIKYVSTISPEPLLSVRSNLISRYQSRSVLCINWIVVFKVKVTVKVQDFIEYLCILHVLYC